MSASSDTNPEPEKLQRRRTAEEHELSTWTALAHELVAAVFLYIDIEAVPPPARTLLVAAGELIQENDQAVKQLALMHALDAVLALAHGPEEVFLTVRNALGRGDPALALIGDHALEVGLDPVPLGIVHEVDGMTLELAPDGGPQISREFSRPFTTLVPKETFALMTFMRLPGVRRLMRQPTTSGRRPAS